MFGAESSACAIARTGDADDLASVVDRRRRGSGIARKGRELLDLIVLQSPDDSPELEDLRRRASGIVGRVLRPPDRLTPVVGAGRITIVAPQSAQSHHRAVSPQETPTRMARMRGSKEGGAGKGLSQRIDIGCFGDAHDLVPVALDR